MVKVCFTQFNTPTGDTFRAIWLAGGHMICTKQCLVVWCHHVHVLLHSTGSYHYILTQTLITMCAMRTQLCSLALYTCMLAWPLPSALLLLTGNHCTPTVSSQLSDSYSSFSPPSLLFLFLLTYCVANLPRIAGIVSGYWALSRMSQEKLHIMYIYLTDLLEDNIWITSLHNSWILNLIVSAIYKSKHYCYITSEWSEDVICM